MSINGKVAIVTGGNSGIGLSIVLQLAKQGANIVIDYVADPEATEALEEQVAALGDQVIGSSFSLDKAEHTKVKLDVIVPSLGALSPAVRLPISPVAGGEIVSYDAKGPRPPTCTRFFPDAHDEPQAYVLLFVRRTLTRTLNKRG